MVLMTFVFRRRFLPKYGDRTVDQMVQAARSGKQNIVEGSADGVTSIESELKLLNVARGSIQELREDYEDYLLSRRLTVWTAKHPRFDMMLRYCREHNQLSDYEPFFEKWNAEEMANIGITLCRMVDKMMMSYQRKKEEEFLAEGGIRERMTAARMNYRANQRETIDQLTRDARALKQENALLRKRIKELGG
ncbi:MAG: four helix bundle suffix domain-containing protein [Bacteroidales bacterium]|nr:four helix bundle suffix domain-containing protein [Bacteroidales bacterium]